MKSVIPIFSTLGDFVENLFVVLDCVRIERHKNVVRLVHNQPI